MRQADLGGFDPGALPPLRDVIARFRLSARKGLGQHFLLDLNLTRRIVRAAGDLDGVTVIEIGPGPGGLTRALLASGARRVVAVERDPRALAALEDLVAAGGGRLRLIAGDARAIDIRAFAEPPAQIVANLPYNIATRLLLTWLDHAAAVRRFTLMFQNEVATRLSAAPGTRGYGRLSVISQWRCEVRRLFDLPARAFTPPPKVTSSLVELVPRSRPLAPARRASLERVTAAAFGQRRKMLRTSLKALGVDSLALLAAAEIAPTARAEEIPVEGFCALARALDETGSG